MSSPVINQPRELHACMGLNACKGHDRLGTNACAGSGVCATAAAHSCHTLNNCRGQGGCGLYGTGEEQNHPGENPCSWQGSCAPFYERWPPLFDQWSLDPETFGWSRFPGGGGSIGRVVGGRATATIAWIDGAVVPASPQLDLRGLVWLGIGREEQVRRAAQAHEEPLAPAVDCVRSVSFSSRSLLRSPSAKVSTLLLIVGSATGWPSSCALPG